MNAYIKLWIHWRQGAKAPKKIVILPDNGNVMTIVMLDYMCVQSFMITHTQCFMLIVKYKVIYVVIA